jgi:hypothetical protein
VSREDYWDLSIMEDDVAGSSCHCENSTAIIAAPRASTFEGIMTCAEEKLVGTCAGALSGLLGAGARVVVRVGSETSAAPCTTAVVATT